MQRTTYSEHIIVYQNETRVSFYITLYVHKKCSSALICVILEPTPQFPFIQRETQVAKIELGSSATRKTEKYENFY